MNLGSQLQYLQQPPYRLSTLPAQEPPTIKPITRLAPIKQTVSIPLSIPTAEGWKIAQGKRKTARAPSSSPPPTTPSSHTATVAAPPQTRALPSGNESVQAYSGHPAQSANPSLRKTRNNLLHPPTAKTETQTLQAQLQMHADDIKPSTSVRFLGVYLDTASHLAKSHPEH